VLVWWGTVTVRGRAGVRGSVQLAQRSVVLTGGWRLLRRLVSADGGDHLGGAGH
jgi:hypothetical protein